MRAIRAVQAVEGPLRKEGQARTEPIRSGAECRAEVASSCRPSRSQGSPSQRSLAPGAYRVPCVRSRLSDHRTRPPSGGLASERPTAWLSPYSSSTSPHCIFGSTAWRPRAPSRPRSTAPARETLLAVAVPESPLVLLVHQSGPVPDKDKQCEYRVSFDPPVESDSRAAGEARSARRTDPRHSFICPWSRGAPEVRAARS